MQPRSEYEASLFAVLAGEALTLETWHTYLLEKKTQLDRIRNYKRSADQKQNWRKLRFKYQNGINRYHRSQKGKEVRNQLRREISAIRGGIKRESVVLSFPEYERFEFLAKLAEVRKGLLEEAYVFDVEESYVDFSIFVECALDSFNKVEASILRGDVIQEADLEMLLAIVTEDSSGIPEEETLLDTFMLEV